MNYALHRFNKFYVLFNTKLNAFSDTLLNIFESISKNSNSLQILYFSLITFSTSVERTFQTAFNFSFLSLGAKDTYSGVSRESLLR